MVVSTKPQYLSTNFEDKKIEITFNEYVNLKDQQKLFIVSPEAAKKPTLTTRGKSVVATFDDTLQKGLTYRLDFGNSIVDNNEGNTLQNFQFTFSTGDHIDSIMMIGQVLDAQSKDTVVGAFIKYFPAEMDSTYHTKGLDSTMHLSYADALFRTDSSGYFLADILQGKPYRIYAYLDNNSSHKYESGIDLIGFSDKIYNPLELPGFAFGYDTLAQRYVADSLQIVFNLFKEENLKRQTFLNGSRTLRNKIQFEFNTHNAAIYIDSMELSGIKKEWLIEDRSTNGDTLTYWIAPPTKAELDSLKDTIRARFIYLSQDSLFRYTPTVREQNLIHKTPKKQLSNEELKAQRDQERKERRNNRSASGSNSGNQPPQGAEQRGGAEQGDTQEGNAPQSDIPQEKPAIADSTTMPQDSVEVEEQQPTLGFRVEAKQLLNPENNIVMTFDYPLTLVDSSKIQLTQKITETKKGTRRGETAQSVVTESEIKPIVTIDGLQKVTISADWVYGAEYSLLIPDSTFHDITFLTNDTLVSKFTIMDPDKFGALTFDITGDPTTQKGTISSSTSLGSEESVIDSLLTIPSDTVEVSDTVEISDTVEVSNIEPIAQDEYTQEIDSIEILTNLSHSTAMDSIYMIENRSEPSKTEYIPELEQHVIDSLVKRYTTKPLIDQSDTLNTYYIVELIRIKQTGAIGASTSEKGSQEVVKSINKVKIGDKIEFKFLAPGDYFLRLTEDIDRNGKWTTGDLRNRIQPERTQIYSDKMGRKRFEAKENWVINEEVNIVEQIEGNF